jgi:methylated-DNA-[protein]-cysteine S-methyltransferase
MLYRYHDSPIGPLLLAADEAGLRQLQMQPQQLPLEAHWQPAVSQLDEVCRQLDEYFAGQRRHFELSLAPMGSAFQLAVWQALRQIPYGETRSYRQLAVQLGRPQAMRAVGAANGANPIAIIVPCHRVIGSNGTLTGFAGGLERKATLLRLEGHAWAEQHILGF